MEWIPGERRKRGRPRKTWMEGTRAAMKTRHLEADHWLNRNGVWVPEDGDSCHKTGKVESGSKILYVFNLSTRRRWSQHQKPPGKFGE
jgi:hypothetical protein